MKRAFIQGLRNIWTIAFREVKSSFLSPLAYVLITVFLLISGIFFYLDLQRFNWICMQYMHMAQQNPELLEFLNLNEYIIRNLFGYAGIILLFLTPIVTMRSLAEEKKTGTAELLFTSPVNTFQIVSAKFLAGFLMVALMILLTLHYILSLYVLGEPDFGPVWSGYLGLLLLGGVFVAVGVFASSLTDNQIVAAVLSFGILFLLWIAGFPSVSGSSALREFLAYLSPIYHFEDFGKGLIDTKHLVFYVTFIFTALFLTQRVLDSRRWR